MELGRWKIFRGVDPLLMSKCKFGKFVHFQRVGFLVQQNDDVYVVTDKDSKYGDYDEGLDVNASKATKVESLCGQSVKDFFGNKCGFAALTTDGCVWVDEDATDPHRSLMYRKVLLPDSNGYQADQMAHGIEHTLCLTLDGQVFAWGGNNFGQLGSRSRISGRKETAAGKVSCLPDNIVQIAAGGFTSFALDSSGRVWSWGENGHSSLGYKASADQLIPQPIENLYNIRKVAAGRFHVLALSETGELYFWGRFNYSTPATPLPAKINLESLELVIDTASTADSECAVFQTKGKVYLWGIWYQQHISEPMATELASINEAFASANSPIMLEPVNIQRHRVEDAWKSAFYDLSTKDVVFSVQNEDIYAHKAFLKVRCEYFRKMLANDTGRPGIDANNVIYIHEFSFRVFKAFIYFLYHESLIDSDMSVEDLAELMRAAVYYGDEDLRLACANKLKSHLSLDNACFLYASAVQSNSLNFQDYIVEFMASEYKQLFKSTEFAKMDNDLKTKLLVRFAELHVFKAWKTRRLEKCHDFAA